MGYKLRIIGILILSFMYGCKNQDAEKASNSSVSSVQENDDVFFKGSGDEWQLQITEDQIRFRSDSLGFESFITPTTEPIRVADANIKNYRVEVESGTLDVRIAQGPCNDSVMDYEVAIKIKRGIDKEFTQFNGCGTYLLDDQTSGTWELSSLWTEAVSVENFREQLPKIEITPEDKRFAGFGGCNQINGSLFTEQNLIRFTDIAQTRMLCAPPNQEEDFLKALRSSTHYSIEGDLLILTNPDRETLRFKKIN
ncbi:META domain-containing protein [Winogradskyella aurantiaca]|uniref:META domain-containing protein n=1 Tax=Winogradskyella aurantiaca TaxID=2219558 RepID=UPI000E1D9E4B|nr:META domain-containing protein [Winogradskyella aurantiaca]